MTTASGPPLNHLVRPEHMLNPKFRFSSQQQQQYLRGCSELWETLRNNPRELTTSQQAYRKLVALTTFLAARLRAIQVSCNNRAPHPSLESAIRILMQQTAGVRPIPSWAEFEAGISAFHDPAQISITDVDALEVSFGGFRVKDEGVEDNVAVALTFLGCDVKSTTAEEIQEVWLLLDIPRGTRGELEDYLRLACR